MILSAVRREDTIIRFGGNGDNWHMSWLADDRQLISLNDGFGWREDPEHTCFNSRLFTIAGAPQDAVIEDVQSFPLLVPQSLEDVPRYYGFGTLAVDGCVYHFMSTFNHDVREPGLRFVGAKLIYSSNGGLDWRNQDGSRPVRWEEWSERSSDTMVFFEEPNEAFSLVSVLQMGCNYADNRDGFVYAYAPNGNVEGKMNELVMFRVAKDRILDRGSYEYFVARDAHGNAFWSSAIGDRGVVHRFPDGRVNELLHPYAWQPSLSFNSGLGLYMMSCWAPGFEPGGEWFTKPSYLGLWSAPEPWGPWTQFHEETAWTPAGNPGARAYSPVIAPKWIAPDGRSFWLVWTEFQAECEPEKLEGVRQEIAALVDGGDIVPPKLHSTYAAIFRRSKPFYALNAQRVDLEVAE